MTLDEIDEACRNLAGCVVRYPFDSFSQIRAWCIGKKMFAWTDTGSQPVVVQLKADPDLVPALIENYEAIAPGYHMNKRHWVSVNAQKCDATLLANLLEDAHMLVAHTLPRAERLRLLGD